MKSGISRDRFYKLSADLAQRRDLTGTTKIIYSIIVNHMGNNGQCWPGYRKLGKEAGVDKETAQKSVEQLSDKGLLDVEKRGSGSSNLYRLPQETVRKTQTVKPAKMSVKPGRSKKNTPSVKPGRYRLENPYIKERTIKE